MSTIEGHRDKRVKNIEIRLIITIGHISGLGFT